ncbi:helix-turn-helix domain-containing protein [Microbulbifer sp. S227A]|uniref:helix-turn-helix domain-containing protein n=1 Tax=Microbulbifer sp. S227A TaxID=3415131 RepID=UPI003C7E547D
MSLFHDRIASAIDASKKYGGNRAQLSRALDMSPNYVSTMLSTKASPSFDISVKLARELEVSLAYLAGSTSQPFDVTDLGNDGPITEQAMKFFDQIAGSLREAASMRGQEPTVDDMMQRWFKYGRQLSGFDKIMEWFDLYRAPGDRSNRIEVLRMGTNSLSARTLGVADRKSLQYALDEVRDSDLQKRLLCAYRRAAEGQPVLSEEALNVLAPGHAEQIRLDYIRLLLPVASDTDGDVIISYSKPLR